MLDGRLYVDQVYNISQQPRTMLQHQRRLAAQVMFAELRAVASGRAGDKLHDLPLFDCRLAHPLSSAPSHRGFGGILQTRRRALWFLTLGKEKMMGELVL